LPFGQVRRNKGLLGNFRQGVSLAKLATMSLNDLVDGGPMDAELGGNVTNRTT
jgi:hypothetical protein